jgi:hypothetical protein
MREPILSRKQNVVVGEAVLHFISSTFVFSINRALVPYTAMLATNIGYA